MMSDERRSPPSKFAQASLQKTEELRTQQRCRLGISSPLSNPVNSTCMILRRWTVRHFCRVFPNDNHKNSRCQEVSNITLFLRIRNRDFENRRNRQKSRNGQPCKTNSYHQYHRNGWQIRNSSLPSNRSGTPSTAGDEGNLNNNNNRDVLRSGPSLSNQTGSKT